MKLFSSRKSLPFYLQISFLLITVSVVLTIIFYQKSLTTQKTFLVKDFKEKSMLLFKTVQLGLEVGLKTESFEAIHTVFGWAKDQRNLKWIIIVDDQSEIFATFPSKVNTSTYLTDKRLDIGRDFYIIEGPWKGDSEKGNLLIGFSTSELRNSEAKLLRQSILVAGVTVIIVIIISLLLSQFMIRPLTKLQKTIEGIAKGKSHQSNVSIGGSSEIISLGDSFNEMMRQLNIEKKKSEDLLLNILPRPIANRLKSGESSISIKMDNISILFADLVGFTEYSSKVTAADLVDMLNVIFTAFDHLVLKYELEKIKTIGDCYMLAGGIFGDTLHERRIFLFAKEMISTLETINKKHHTSFQIRIGIHSGPAVAGVLGKIKFVFDVWGDTVNIASRMESSGEPGHIQVSNGFKDVLVANMDPKIIDRGPIMIKGKGEMNCFFVS